MRILGIDPGLQRTGWGIIDSTGNRLTHISHGVIATDSKKPLSNASSKYSMNCLKWLPCGCRQTPQSKKHLLIRTRHQP